MTQRRIDVDESFVLLDDGLDGGEADAAAGDFVRARVGRAREDLEDLVHVLFGDAAPGVGDLELPDIGALEGVQGEVAHALNRYGDAPVGGVHHVLDRVVDQVLEHLADAVFLGVNRWEFAVDGELDLCFFPDQTRGCR